VDGVAIVLTLLGVFAIATFCAVAPWTAFETRRAFAAAAKPARDGAPNSTEFFVTALECALAAVFVAPVALAASHRWGSGTAAWLLPVEVAVPGTVFAGLFALRLGIRLTRGPRLPPALGALIRILSLAVLFPPVALFQIAIVVAQGHLAPAMMVACAHGLAALVAALLGVIAASWRWIDDAQRSSTYRTSTSMSET
jgi:hypothetical protein